MSHDLSSHPSFIKERIRKHTKEGEERTRRSERGMGNYRFKLSDMIPNAWFYKLKDMGRTRKQDPTRKKKKLQSLPSSTTQQSSKQPKQQPHQCNPRKSYYFTRELTSNNNNNNNNKIFTSPTNNNIKNQNGLDYNFPQPARKSSKQRPKRRTPKNSSPQLENSSSLVDSSEEELTFPDPEIRTDRVLLPSLDDDIIIDVDNNSIARKDDKLNEYENDCFSELMMLPPIVTKPEKFNDLLEVAKKKQTKPRNRMAAKEEHNVKGSLKVKILKDEQRNNTISGSRRISLNSPGVRLRINSPRIGGRKVQAHGRKSISSSASGGFRRSLSESFAIVKSSVNPQRDFRESMVEMIVQNNIRTSKDLEDLLACYLSLNSDEYHDLIIKVFKQIWFDLTDNQ